jgi:hypothetical protein
MSLDYTRHGTVAKFYGPTDLSTGAYANNTQTMKRGHIVSYDKNWMIQGAQIRIITAATNNGHTFLLEKSDSSGSFASAVPIASINFGNTDAAGTKATTGVVGALADLVPGEVIRCRHTATGTDASLVYEAEVIATPRLD